MKFSFEELDVGELMELTNKFYENNKYEGRYSYFSLLELKELFDSDKLVELMYKNRTKLNGSILYTNGELFYTLSEDEAKKEMLEEINKNKEYCLELYVNMGGEVYD